MSGKIVNNQSKAKLDKILTEHRAQPVGDGYFDIIVAREDYQTFVEILFENGFQIEAISWWEYLETQDTPNTYGMGGPRSKYHPGWYSEVGSIDKIPSSHTSLAEIFAIVQNKELGKYKGKQISFRKTKSLTPAFCLSVDKSWKCWPEN